MILRKRPGSPVVAKRRRVKRRREGIVGKAEALVELERRACLADLSTFCRLAWPELKPQETYLHNWHIEVMCYHLMGLFFRWPMTSGPRKGEPLRDLVINIPPRHMKSLICSVMFLAWAWAHDPGRQFFWSSYAQHLSDEHSSLMLQLVQSDWYQQRFGKTGNPVLDSDGVVALGSKRQTRHFTTDQGGARQASSVMGKATGAGGDILGVDDAHNLMQRESERAMAKTITWWSKSMVSRGNNPRTFCRLIVGQRVAENDLPGWCKAQGYAALVIPARYEGTKEIGVFKHVDPRTEEGEPMWANHFGDVELSVLEASLLEDAAGQLQQRPAPAGGNVFKINSLRRMSRRVRNALLKPGILEDLIVSFDLGLKGRSSRGRKRSWSVGAVWGRKGGDVFLFDLWRMQGGPVEIQQGVEDFCRAWPNARIKLIEEGGAGYAVAANLEGKVPGITTVRPKGDKDLRAAGIAPFFVAGNVWVPTAEWAPWVDEWTREHEFFPNSANDDQVDTTSQALDYLLVGAWVAPMMPEGGRLIDEMPVGMGEDVGIAAARQQADLRRAWADDTPGGVTTRQFTGRGWEPV